MAAIAGIIAKQQPDRVDLQPILADMRHRGLSVHTLISSHSIVGTVGQDDSYVSSAENGKIVVVVDARFERRAHICAKTGLPKDASDAQLVLAAYRKWGRDCPAYLDGDFAFVVVDGAQVYCARDHLGVKPFYYGLVNGVFVFASEARPVALYLNLPVNEERIADSLCFPLEHFDKTSTFYRGVNRLPPGTHLTSNLFRTDIGLWWHPAEAEEPACRSEADYTEAFCALLEVSVGECIDDGATAGSLSGGIDSGTIVGVASRIGSPLRTFSCVSEPGVACQETRLINLAIERMNLDAFTLTPSEMHGHIGACFERISLLQEPFDCFMIEPMLINMIASEQGFTSLLDGVEGDMLHSLSEGYPSVLMREGLLSLGVQGIYDVWSKVYGRETFLPAHIYRHLRLLGLPKSLKFLKSVKNLFMHPESSSYDSLISKDFAQSVDLEGRLETLRETFNGGADNTQDMHLRAVVHPALPAALERYDRTSALTGIERRHPLVSKQLIEFSLKTPWRYKVANGWSKYLLRRAGSGVVPDEIRWQVSSQENSRQFVDEFIRVKAKEMREAVSDSRHRLLPYIDAAKLEKAEGGDLLQLFALLKWLENQQ